MTEGMCFPQPIQVTLSEGGLARQQLKNKEMIVKEQVSCWSYEEGQSRKIQCLTPPFQQEYQGRSTPCDYVIHEGWERPR